MVMINLLFKTILKMFLFFNKYDDAIEKKDPEMCEVCDMAQFDQQIQECIQSIILEQPKSMHDSYSFEDSVEKEVQLVDIIDDTIQKESRANSG